MKPRAAGFWERVSALLVDTFMILIPITAVLMVVVGSEKMKTESFAAAGAIQMFMYGAITVAFWVKKGYTPGKKAMRLLVLDRDTMKTISLPQAILRFLCIFVSIVSVVGLLMPALREDKRALHDILSSTCVVRI
ncbi:MAG: RDD family protein [Helicobacteraceae bacterium]|jgi:uncharacterized RDD family membrane protein YckC|nr:RDD family protein [Helicobacteraceae bacterium]